MAATNTPVPAPPSRPRQVARRTARRFGVYLLGSLLGALVLVGLYTLFMLWYPYSEGERAGVLQKFSRRGWICKTYEGEVAMYVVGGVAPQIWDFSVRDPEIAAQLHQAVGQQVRLHYREHRGLPTDCFGETNYFVDRIESVSAPSPAPSPVPNPAQPASEPPRP